ncbi:hypothetical protein VM1G_05028 [Cytospora mali]|uniref:Uncharacterized protein n=1 Tax=Cytospora mali TaxID=578113 RepID=A0A194VYF1_CYTMA|nr:hypothetical protein VM1G_05028 [Valsa mali]
MPQSTLEQFIRFGTDAAGIERVLRMAQAILMVIISQPLLTNAFVELVSLGNKHLWEEPRVANRRTGAGASQAPAEAWLDISARAFNGMYLLLETATLVDALGFPLWGPYWSARLAVEGQRFWFLALACGVASGLTRIVKLFAYAPKKAEGDMMDWERERERLRRIMWPRREQRRLWRANIRGKLRGLVRKCVADFLDLAVPGSVVGWVKVDSGTVGALMVVTTYLTGMDLWERFGNDSVRK